MFWGAVQFSQGAEVDAGNGMGPDASLEATMTVRVPSQVRLISNTNALITGRI